MYNHTLYYHDAIVLLEYCYNRIMIFYLCYNSFPQNFDWCSAHDCKSTVCHLCISGLTV
jgi:hypothetical protein